MLTAAKLSTDSKEEVKSTFDLDATGVEPAPCESLIGGQKI